MAGPLSPSEVVEKKEKQIPEKVFDTVNELIVEKWDGHSATIQQDTIVERLVTKHGLDRHEIFEKHWLDFEDVYRRKGWRVKYDKPGYNETYAATFEFSKGPTRGIGEPPVSRVRDNY